MHEYAKGLLEGKYVKANVNKALELFKSASDLGYGRASNHYAVIKKEGLYSVPVNKEEAVQYLKIAIQEGYPPTMFNYANMLRNGEFLPVNKEEAAKYFKMGGR